VIRLYVVVEGQTEESFVASVLAPVLWESDVHPTPILLGPSGQKGGGTSYARVSRDVRLLLKQDHGAYCSTMIDLYGLGEGFQEHLRQATSTIWRRFATLKEPSRMIFASGSPASGLTSA